MKQFSFSLVQKSQKFRCEILKVHAHGSISIKKKLFLDFYESYLITTCINKAESFSSNRLTPSAEREVKAELGNKSCTPKQADKLSFPLDKGRLSDPFGICKKRVYDCRAGRKILCFFGRIFI